jgi:ribonuclease T2
MPIRGLRLAALIVLGGLVLLGLFLVFLAKPDIDRRAAGDGSPSARFDYYVLVLSWSPTYCANKGASRNDPQCTRAHRRAFVLHGLWPQNIAGWPQNCAAETRSWVPQSVIDGMRDIMPGKNLMIHEYRAHGTCAGLAPEQYFGLARDLYERITIPPHFAGLDRRLVLSPDEIEGEFLKANPWLSPSMVSVTCRRQELLDVRFCFGRDLLPRSCGPNEDHGLCRTPKVGMSPAEGR